MVHWVMVMMQNDAVLLPLSCGSDDDDKTKALLSPPLN